MRVRGSKQRVRLTEVELEPSEQKPMLRIAPAAASLIWLGSITLATAIYMEWLPARALFGSRTPEASERPARSVASEPRSPKRARAPTPPLAVSPGVESTEPSNEPLTATAEATAERRTSASETTITTPRAVRESSRTIRGSYYSEDSSWAAGW